VTANPPKVSPLLISNKFASLFPAPDGAWERHRYKVFLGGRASAKSHSIATALVLDMWSSTQRVGCFREVQKSIRDSVHQLLADKIKALGLGADFEIQRDRIICHKTGSTAIFVGLSDHTVESVKSLEGLTRAWLEEGQAITARSWSIFDPTIRAPGAEIWISYNPTLDKDIVHQEFAGESPPTDAVVTRVSFRDNLHWNDELDVQRERLKRNDPDAYLHVWEGHTLKSNELAIFRGKYTVEDFQATTVWGSPLYGADWGFGSDPTVLVRLWLHDDALWIDYESFAWEAELSDLPEVFAKVPGATEHVIRADNSRPELIRYMARSGYPLTRAADKWAGSIKDGIDYLKGNFERIVIHPRCTHMIEEASLYSYKKNARTGDPLPEPDDKHNHGWDSCRYAIEPLITRSGAPAQRRVVPSFF